MTSQPQEKWTPGERDSVTPRVPFDLRPPFVVVLATALTTLLGACISNPGPRETARAEVSGPDGVPVRLITSTQFAISQNSTGTTPDSTAAQLFSADTTFREFPFEVSANIQETRRYLVRVSMAPETDSVAGTGPIDTSVQLFVDGERETEASGNLRESSVQVIFQSFTNQ